MNTKMRLITLTTAAVLAGTMTFAQAVDVPNQPPAFDFSFLSDLFTGGDLPSGDAIADALAGAGLTVDRMRSRSDGEVRIEATTEDGQRVRIRVEDGEVRYRIRPASDDSGDDDSDDDSSDDHSDGHDDSDDRSDDKDGGSGHGSDDKGGDDHGGDDKGGSSDD